MVKIAPQPERMGRARHSPPVAGHTVDVHIEELVLHGFVPGDRRRIAGAVESELTRLMSEAGLPGFSENPPAIGRVNGGAFRVEAGSKPQATGTEIAQAVYRGLRQHARAVSRVNRLARNGQGRGL